MNSMKHMLIILSKALLSSNTNQWFDFPLRQHMNNILLPECFQEELNEFGTLINNTEQPKRYGWCGSYNPEWGAKVLPSDVNEFRAYIDSMENDKDEHGYFDIDTTHGNSYLAYRFNDGIEARLCTSNGTWTYYLPNDSNRDNYTCPPKMMEYLFRRTEDLLKIDRDRSEQVFNDARAAGLLKLTNNITKIRDRLVEADQFSKCQAFSNGSSACKVIWNQAHEPGDQFTLSMDIDDFTINEAGLLVVRQYDGTTKDLLLYSVKAVNKLIDMTEYVNEDLSTMISYPSVGQLKLERPDYGYHPDTTIKLSVVCEDSTTISKSTSVWFKDVLTDEQRKRLNEIRVSFNSPVTGCTMNSLQATMLAELDKISEDYIAGPSVDLNLNFANVSRNHDYFIIPLYRPNVVKLLETLAKLCNVTWYNMSEYPDLYEEVMGRPPVTVTNNHFVTGNYQHTIDLDLVKAAILHLRDHADLSEFTY